MLAGSIRVAKVEAGEFDSRTFKRWLDKALTKKDDRAVIAPSPARDVGACRRFSRSLRLRTEDLHRFSWDTHFNEHPEPDVP